MTCRGVAGCGSGTYTDKMMLNNVTKSKELSSLEGTRGQFNVRRGAIKLGIDVHQSFGVVVLQEGGSNPKPAQRMSPTAFLPWAAKLRRSHPGAALHAVYEACGFGFGLQRALTALGITCHVVCPQKLDERHQRVKTDGRDAKALCQKLDRYVEGNRDALAVVRVPTPEEEQPVCRIRTARTIRRPTPTRFRPIRQRAVGSLTTSCCSKRRLKSSQWPILRWQ